MIGLAAATVVLSASCGVGVDDGTTEARCLDVTNLVTATAVFGDKAALGITIFGPAGRNDISISATQVTSASSFMQSGGSGALSVSVQGVVPSSQVDVGLTLSCTQGSTPGTTTGTAIVEVDSTENGMKPPVTFVWYAGGA